jgi:hypothetical protein
MMEGVNSSMIYLIHYKNFCKCHNVPYSTQQLKREREKEVDQVYRDKRPQLCHT